MPEYLHPGVYVEEVSSGVRPIEGVGTSTAGFVGLTSRGVPNRATFITSWSQFVRAFGYLDPDSYLPYAVSQFFGNGGKRCYIVRVLNDASAVAASGDLLDREGTPQPTLRVTALGKGAWGNDLAVRVDDGTANPTREFKLLVYHGTDDAGRPVLVEVFDNLSMDPASAGYVETEINGASDYIEVEDLDAHVAPARATATTGAPLAASVPFLAAGEDVVIEMPDGTTNTVTLTGATNRDDVVTAFNNAWGPLNVSASLTATNALQVVDNRSGFERYFAIGGAATGVGRPLAGLAGFAQGQGAAVGATLKSAVAPGPGNVFAIAAGSETLSFTVSPDPAFNVALAVGNRTPAQIASELNTDFQNNRNGLLVASVEGNRVVVATANRGANNAQLAIGGTANALLDFQDFARAGATATGQGSSEAAFVQSDVGPFALEDGASFSLQVNNGAGGAASPAVTVTFSAATTPNLQQVSAATLSAAINAAAPAGTVVSSVVNGRVVVRQARRGSYYTLQLVDGVHSPNIRLKFETARQRGYAEGEKTSPYYRPGFNLDIASVNQPWPLGSGDDGSPPSSFDFIGSADKKTGLHALDDVTDVNFIAIPGEFEPGLVGQGVAYCTNRKDCFYIADPPGKEDKDTPVTDPATVRNYLLNQIPTKESYAGLYYPWLEIDDPVGAGRNPKRFVPPSGFMAGLFARIDTERGVHKAPAGTEATVLGALRLEYSVTDAEQDILNPVGVNCIREFPASGLVVWGARTMGTQSDPEWRYVPIRRYAIYLEVSIYRGTQWAVFEPNDERLWESLTANITDFMMGEFRKGALAGTKPDLAFEVKCDADLNPPAEVAAGRVNMEVKFAPLRPAEFVIIRISQKSQRPGG